MKSALLAVFFFMSLLSLAEPLHGYIVFNDGHVKKVIFKIPFLPGKKTPDYGRLQKNIKYQFNFRGHSLIPAHGIEGYVFFYESDTIRMLRMEFQNSFAMFLKIHIDGTLTLLDNYEAYSDRPYYILFKGSELISITPNNYEETIAALHSSCGSYDIEMDLDEETRSSLPHFVRWYNKHCEN